MFGYVMSDPERCKQFLEQILDIQIDHVEYLEKQKSIDMKIDAKVLMYPHLGHKTWLDLVEEFNPTENEIKDYLLMVEEVA